MDQVPEELKPFVIQPGEKFTSISEVIENPNSDESRNILNSLASKYIHEDLGLQNWGVDADGSSVLLDCNYSK